MTTTPTAVRASAVSATIRRGGVLPSPAARRYKHEGVFVSRSALRNEVHVAIDLDGRGERARLAEVVTEILVAAGYTVRQARGTDGGFMALYVTRPAS